jgi:hypothetical protein
MSVPQMPQASTWTRPPVALARGLDPLDVDLPGTLDNGCSHVPAPTALLGWLPPARLDRVEPAGLRWLRTRDQLASSRSTSACASFRALSAEVPASQVAPIFAVRVSSTACQLRIRGASRAMDFAVSA